MWQNSIPFQFCSPILVFIILDPQVFDAQTLKLVRNISSSSTQLTFTDLPASRDFLLQVLVEQDGIISEPFRTDAFTLRANDKQLAASTEKDSSNSARSVLYVRDFSKGIFPTDNFPRVFYLVATFQMCNFPSLQVPLLQRSAQIPACNALETLT